MSRAKTNRYDVIVIGAGPTGLMTALEAVKRGLNVLILEKRAPLKRRGTNEKRFQAIIVDIQTLNNLHNVGMSITANKFHPIVSAELFTSDREPAQSIPYHYMPTNFVEPSSDDLNALAFRRRIAAITSITQIEAGLLQLIESNESIDCLFEQEIEQIIPGAINTIITNKAQFGARYLAIADGANSDQNGALKKLSVEKQRLAHKVEIALVRFADAHRSGQLKVKESAGQHAALFGLADETIVYTNVLNDDAASINQHIKRITKSFGMNGNPIAKPVLISQQAARATTVTPTENILILGDAAQSGTAILGVYFNKGISDAIAFGLFLDHRDTNQFQRRGNSLAAKMLLIEEHLIGSAWDDTFGILRQFTMGQEMAQSIPRALFRLKAGRHGLMRTLATNSADIMASYATGLAHSLPDDKLKSLSYQSAKLMRALQRTLEEN